MKNTQKHHFNLRMLLITAPILLFAYTTTAQVPSLKEQISKLYGVKSIEAIESGTFSEKYEITIEQPLNYEDTTLGKFSQRFFVAHVGYDRPTVIVTEGYTGDYAANPRYREELSRLFNANMIFVEHRYFSKSTPNPLKWEYLTAEASANDLHRINRAMRSIYKGKWISTGISKGGQTTMIYRTFFPDDVDISVPYVAPLCVGIEDGRHEPFIANVPGTVQDRQKVKDFQLEVLKRRNILMPMFKDICTQDKLEFNASLDEIYDYSVLEYSFSFWQWGNSTSTIPALNSPDSVIFKHFITISHPNYFQKTSPTSAFFVQAAKELGYYGYDTKPFKKYLTIKDSKGYLKKLVVPQNSAGRFDRTLYRKIQHYLNENDPKMIFIYGEWDPWSAVAASFPTGKENMVRYFAPKGSHMARISTMPEPMKKEIISKIEKWLNE